MALCPSQSRVARRVPGCFLLPCTFSEVNGTLANCLSQKLMPCVGRMAIARRLTSCSSASLMRPALLDVRILCCARSTGIGVEPLQLSRHGLDPALTWKMAPTCGDACFFNLNSPAWSLTEDPPYAYVESKPYVAGQHSFARLPASTAMRTASLTQLDTPQRPFA